MVVRGWVVVVWDQSAVDASIKDIAELSERRIETLGGLMVSHA